MQMLKNDSTLDTTQKVNNEQSSERHDHYCILLVYFSSSKYSRLARHVMKNSTVKTL